MGRSQGAESAPIRTVPVWRGNDELGWKAVIRFGI